MRKKLNESEKAMVISLSSREYTTNEIKENVQKIRKIVNLWKEQEFCVYVWILLVTSLVGFYACYLKGIDMKRIDFNSFLHFLPTVTIILVLLYFCTIGLLRYLSFKKAISNNEIWKRNLNRFRTVIIKPEERAMDELWIKILERK